MIEEIIEKDPSGVLAMIQHVNALLECVDKWEDPRKHQARSYLFSVRHNLVCFWEFIGCPEDAPPK